MGNGFAASELADCELSLVGTVESPDCGLVCQVRLPSGHVKKVIVRCPPPYIQAAQALLEYLTTSIVSGKTHSKSSGKGV